MSDSKRINIKKIMKDIRNVYTEWGHLRYVVEVDASSLDHARQAGYLAELQGCSQGLIAAAFLHDIGHLLLKEDDETRLKSDQGHGRVGYEYLKKQGFPPIVTDSIRLHVPAKRYLCGSDKTYYDKLLTDSKRSLVLQGGPMSPAECEDFIALPYALGGVQVRRFDDQAKRPTIDIPKLPPPEHYFEIIEAVLLRTNEAIHLKLPTG